MDSSARARDVSPAPRRVAIFRALKLGDTLCAVPALRAFRAAWPGAELVLVGLPWAREFVERFHRLLDGFREFPGYPGLPERPVDVAAIPEFLRSMQAERFDLVIQLHGSGSLTNPLCELFGAARTAGFFVPGQYCPDPAWFAPWPTSGLEVRRLLTLVERLGLPARGDHLEFPIGPRDREGVRAALGSNELQAGRYACLHPGASAADRRWPVERFAAVGDQLAARGFRVVITGTAGEARLTAAVAHSMTTPAIDLAGCTGLGPLAALIEGAGLLVCNDTGVSHLSAALRTPSVVLSTGEHADRWSPADARRHRVLRGRPLVELDEALAEIDRLLADVPGLAA